MAHEAVVHLVDPKNPHNVGGAIRAAAAFGAHRVTWGGERVTTTAKRLPREERMKGYQDVEFWHLPGERTVSGYAEAGWTPVCVEVDPTAEQLHQFIHPERALYVFGPEDGSVPKAVRAHCHRFVVIPTLHCTNLSAAVYLTLYDRHVKLLAAGLRPQLASADLLAENRGWVDHWNLEEER